MYFILKSSFDNLLNKDKSVSIHHKNFRSLAIEIRTVHCDISPKVLNDPFPLNLFGATLLPKICHTYPTMIKLGTVIRYTKKIQNIYEPRDTSLEFY